MPFIGQQPLTGAYSKLDAITTSATATYNLQLDGSAYSPASANHLLVSLNGVMQAPQDSFTVSGSTITFASALTSSDNIDFIMALGDVLNIGTPSDGTVTAGKIASGAVTNAKIASGISSSKLTGALPALDGSALTGVSAGKVLQVVNTLGPSSQVTKAGAGSIEVVNASITPSSTSSKLYIMTTSNVIGSGGSNTYVMIQIFRGSTNIHNGPYSGDTSVANAPVMLGANLLDTPNTTSATTYKLQLERVSSGTNGFYALANRSTITLMEIEG